MQVVIDIPDLTYESIMKSKVLKDVGADFIRNGKPLPDNATNGDVIKAVFPNGKTVKTNGLEIGYRPAKPNDKWIIWFMQEWWNAPYKVGDTDGNS